MIECGNAGMRQKGDAPATGHERHWQKDLQNDDLHSCGYGTFGNLLEC